MTTCPKCGSEVTEGYSFCGSCGTRIGQVPPPQQYHYPYPYYQPQPAKDSSSSVVAIIFIVIAIIVIVTVVLAAVLYVMVVGFGGVYYSTPAGAWSDAEATSSTSGRLTFGAFTEEVMPSDLRLHVYADGASAGYVEFSTPYSATTALSWSNRPDSSTALYYDYNYMGNQVNPGDYIEFEGLAPGTEYSFTLFHVPTDAEISMTGDTPVFNTP